MSRSLGDGTVAEVRCVLIYYLFAYYLDDIVSFQLLKTYAYIEDEKLGRVYFPIAAANVRQNCYDLRMKFAVSFVYEYFNNN